MGWLLGPTGKFKNFNFLDWDFPFNPREFWEGTNFPRGPQWEGFLNWFKKGAFPPGKEGIGAKRA